MDREHSCTHLVYDQVRQGDDRKSRYTLRSHREEHDCDTDRRDTAWVGVRIQLGAMWDALGTLSEASGVRAAEPFELADRVDSGRRSMVS